MRCRQCGDLIDEEKGYWDLEGLDGVFCSEKCANEFEDSPLYYRDETEYDYNPNSSEFL